MQSGLLYKLCNVIFSWYFHSFRCVPGRNMPCILALLDSGRFGLCHVHLFNAFTERIYDLLEFVWCVFPLCVGELFFL